MTQELNRDNSITASGGSVMLTVSGMASAAVQITGTWVGTLQIEATINGTNWFSLTSINPASFTTLTSTTSNVQFFANVAGLMAVRVRASAWTSGTANVALRAAISNGSGAVVETQQPGYEVNVGTGYARVRQPCAFTNLTADTAVLSGTGWFYGFICNSTTAGTVKFYDNTAASGTVIMNTFTPIASTVYILPATIVGTGIYADITNTIDITVLFAPT